MIRSVKGRTLVKVLHLTYFLQEDVSLAVFTGSEGWGKEPLRENIEGDYKSICTNADMSLIKGRRGKSKERRKGLTTCRGSL